MAPIRSRDDRQKAGQVIAEFISDVVCGRAKPSWYYRARVPKPLHSEFGFDAAFDPEPFQALLTEWTAPVERDFME